MLCITRWLPTVSVTTQIWRNDPVTGGHQLWCDFPPSYMRLWMAVKQQDGVAGPCTGVIYLNIGQARLRDLEPRQETGQGHSSDVQDRIGNRCAAGLCICRSAKIGCAQGLL